MTVLGSLKWLVYLHRFIDCSFVPKRAPKKMQLINLNFYCAKNDIENHTHAGYCDWILENHPYGHILYAKYLALKSSQKVKILAY